MDTVMEAIKHQVMDALERAMLDLEIPMAQGCDILQRFERELDAAVPKA